MKALCKYESAFSCPSFIYLQISGALALEQVLSREISLPDLFYRTHHPQIQTVQTLEPRSFFNVIIL